MNKLQFAYNLGIAEDFDKGLTDKESYQRKINMNKALKCSLCTYQKQLGYVKSFTTDYDPSKGPGEMRLKTYKDELLSLAYSMVQRNVQATNNKLNKLTGYGWHLNDIRKQVYADQNTERGYVGTLAYHQPQGNQISSGLDFLEQTVVNYYTSIGLNAFDSPRAKYLKVLEEVGINPTERYYEDLQTTVLNAINTNSDVSDLLTLNLMNTEDVKRLQPKVLLLELDSYTIEFFDYLFTNNFIDLDIETIKTNSINFGLIGGIPLFLVTLAVESLIVVARYITLLTEQQKNTNISTFVRENEAEAQQIAEYLALAFDACDYLKYSLEEFNLLGIGILNDLKRFLINDIESEGGYRLDG